MRALKALRNVALGVVLTGAALVGYVTSSKTQEDQGVVASFISKMLSTPGTVVTIGSVDGALSSNPVIRNVTVADSQGVFLKVDQISMDWSRAALLARRLDVSKLAIGKVELARRPVPDPAAPPQPGSEGPLLPELPLKLIVGSFTLAELALGEPVLGVAARLAATGKATLGPPTEGLDATLDIKRLDAAGTAAIRLLFVPGIQQLDLKIVHDEPAGGIAARLLGIPGLPPVKLDVAGAGVLDAWRSQLVFDAGPGINARGSAVLGRAGPLRRLTLDLTAQVENMLPPAVGTVFSGNTTLNSSVVFGDDGGVAIETTRLASAIADLTVSGYLTATKQLDVALKARALKTEGNVTRKGEVALERLIFDATAKGPLTGPTIDGKLDLGGLDSPELKLGTLLATLNIAPIGTSDTPRFRLVADGRTTGLVVEDPGLSQAIGGNATLSMRGTVDENGIADFTEAKLASPNLAVSFLGKVGPKLIDARVEGEIIRLASLSRLTGQTLEGRALVKATLTGDPAARRVRAVIEGGAREFRVGNAIANRLTGGTLELSGTVTTAPGDVLLLDKVTAKGQNVAAIFNGRVAAAAMGLDADLVLPDLAKIDAKLSGDARVVARVSGPQGDPNLNIRATAADVRVDEQRIRDLVLSVVANKAVSLPDVTVAVTGDVAGKPLKGDVKAQKIPAGGWTLSQLAATLGSVSIDGMGRIDGANIANGRIAVVAGDLADIAPLAMTRMRGALKATIVADAPNNQQRIVIDADGTRIVAGTISLNTLKAALRADDLYGRTVLNGEATVDRLVAAGETVERIALTANGTTQASDITFVARARGFDLAAEGKLLPEARKRLDLAKFTATRGAARIALARPASFVLEDNGQISTERATLTVQGGEIEVRGKLGAVLDVAVDARRVPLAAADIFAPGTGLRGVLDAKATLKGPAATPEGPFEVTIAGLSAPQTRDNGVPPLAIRATGRLDDGRAIINASVNGGTAIRFTIDGSAPLSAQGNLDIRARGTLDAALANARIAADGRRVTGRVTVDATIRGTTAKPDVQGSAVLAGGTFSDPLAGVALTGIEGRLTGRGDVITVDRITARTKNGGVIQVSGRISADADAGFPADLRITANNAQLVSSDIAEVTASLNLSVTGPLSRAPRLGGRIDVSTIEVRVPDRLPSAVEPLRNARHIAPPPQTRARLAQIARVKALQRRGKRAPPFNAVLDLVIDAPGRVFVRGRGIDAELGGQVRLTGTSSDPHALGAFELRRGRLAILTQRINLTRGRLTFGGVGIIPDLDLVAETQAADVTARVAITGPATEPNFALTSSPDLPQDEVLSRLLFARASGGLSPFQAIQLAQAVSQLAGNSNGPDLFEQTRRALGVDDLDIGAGADGPTVGISKAISNRMRLGIKAGTKPENTSVGVDIDLTRRLKVQTEIGPDGRASVGIGAEIEY